MIKLKLSPTISLAQPNDISSDEDDLMRPENTVRDNLVEGYIFTENRNERHPYKFFAEINIDNDRLWSLFKTLMMAMPEYQSLLTAYRDDIDNDVVRHGYEDKYAIYNKIECFQKELTQDVFLKFGVIYQDESFLEEVFVCSYKYIWYWGMDAKSFREIMDSYSLYEVKNLKFIDNYPIITRELTYIDEEALSTDEVLTRLRTKD